jgi:hypothetical protein
MPRPPPDHRTAPPRGGTARVPRALQHPPPAPRARSAPAPGRTPPPSGATVRPLRRDRLGGLLHEYVQVA